MALPLTVPQPALFDADDNPLAAGALLPNVTDPVKVKLAAPARGATALGVTDLKAGKVMLVRVPAAGTEELWNKETSQWAASVPEAGQETMPLEYKPEDSASPWQGELYVTGAEGKFAATEASGYPQYAVRAAFTTQKEQTGQSVLSVPFKLPPPPHENQLAGVRMTPSMEAPATLELYLDQWVGSNAAKLVLEKSGKVTLVNKSGARVTLEGATLKLEAGGATLELTGGNIILTPAPGKKTILKTNTEIQGTWSHP